MIGVFKMIFL